MKQKKLLSARIWLLIALAIVVVAGIVLLIVFTDVQTLFTSVDALRDYIAQFGSFGMIVFFVIQLISVILAPIPSNVTTIAGAILFGFWPSFLISVAATIGGAMIVFLLAKRFGFKFANRFIQKKVSDKYLKLMENKLDVFLILVFLLPFFPDDIICILAGLTPIKTGRFFVIVVTCRPWGLLGSAMLGSATLRLPVWAWAIVAALTIGVFIAGLKYGDKIEQALIRKFKRHAKPEEKELPKPLVSSKNTKISEVTQETNP